MRPLRASAHTYSRATRTVTSPLTQSACAPRATREPAASRTADELSTFASISSIPIPLQGLRAALVNAAEFASAEFQGSPIDLRLGYMDRAIWNAPSTGIILPNPTRCFG